MAGMCRGCLLDEFCDQNGGSSLWGVAQGSEPCWERAPAARRLAASPRVVAVAAGRGTAGAALAAARIARDLRCGITQRWADLVYVDLEDRTPLAVTGLVAARPEPALHDDPHPLLQGLGDVLSCLAPHRAVEEHRIAVAPLVGLTIEGAWCGRDGEVCDRRTEG